MRVTRNLPRISLWTVIILFLVATLVSQAAAQTCVQPPSDMISWWTGDGHAHDIQGGNHGTLLNGVAFATGRVAQAFSFAGITEEVVVPDAANLDVQNTFTIEAWLNVAEPRVTARILGRSGATTVGYSLLTDSTGTRYRCNIDNGPTDFDVFSTTPISLETFQHIACTFDGSTLRVYVDGVLAGSTPAAVMPDIDRPLIMGGTGITAFKGLIDEIGIYNRALSAAEIQAIAAAGSAGKCLPAIKVSPNKGGDTGSVSVSILGNRFAEGATVKLVRDGQTDIMGEPTRVESSFAIITTFDLTGKAQGLWDVVVTNPAGTFITLPAGFTIEEGRTPQLWVDIVGRNVIRAGQLERIFYVFNGNRGNVDAKGVLLWIGIPKAFSWRLGFDFETVSPPPVSALEPTDWS